MMTALITWAPTAIFLMAGVAIFIGRNAVKAWISSGVQHSFDVRIEKLRTELHQQTELFKNELAAKDDQIGALRDGALAGLVSRRTALDKRRLEAVDRLWSAVVSLAPLQALSGQMRSINYQAAAKAAVNEPKLRQVFELLGQNIDPKQLPASSAAKEQPFLSAKTWALFSAYNLILHHAFLQIKTLQMGFDATDVIEHKNIVAIIKTALPEYSDYIDAQGSSSYHQLVEILEQKLLEELQNTLNGVEASAEDVQKAAAILKAVNAAQAEMTKPTAL